MGWQWDQLDHMQIICISLQSDNHRHSIFTGWMLFLAPNQQCQITEGNRMLICWFIITSFKPQGCGHCSTNCCYLSTASECKPKWTFNCKNCSYLYAYHCTQVSYTIQHRTVLIIFPLILQTVIIAKDVVSWRRGYNSKLKKWTKNKKSNLSASCDWIVQLVAGQCHLGFVQWGWAWIVLSTTHGTVFIRVNHLLCFDAVCWVIARASVHYRTSTNLKRLLFQTRPNLE